MVSARLWTELASAKLLLRAPDRHGGCWGAVRKGSSEGGGKEERVKREERITGLPSCAQPKGQKEETRAAYLGLAAFVRGCDSSSANEALRMEIGTKSGRYHSVAFVLCWTTRFPPSYLSDGHDPPYILALRGHRGLWRSRASSSRSLGTPCNPLPPMAYAR